MLQLVSFIFAISLHRLLIRVVNGTHYAFVKSGVVSDERPIQEELYDSSDTSGMERITRIVGINVNLHMYPHEIQQKDREAIMLNIDDRMTMEDINKALVITFNNMETVVSPQSIDLINLKILIKTLEDKIKECETSKEVDKHHHKDNNRTKQIQSNDTVVHDAVERNHDDEDNKHSKQIQSNDTVVHDATERKRDDEDNKHSKPNEVEELTETVQHLINEEEKKKNETENRKRKKGKSESRDEHEDEKLENIANKQKVPQNIRKLEEKDMNTSINEE